MGYGGITCNHVRYGSDYNWLFTDSHSTLPIRHRLIVPLSVGMQLSVFQPDKERRRRPIVAGSEYQSFCVVIQGYKSRLIAVVPSLTPL